VDTGHGRWILGGGIGTGKSEVRRLLAANGIATIDADSIGHQVLESSGSAFVEVAATWPQVVVEGEIDRSRLAGIVFGDDTELRRLESITHPHIFDTIRDQVEEIDGVVVVEMPILATGLGEEWRRMVVDSHGGVRLDRAIGRGTSVDDAKARMASQPTRAEWLAAADLVVPNHGSMEDLEATVSRLTSRPRNLLT
jgi:dephospho-CoA kinase